ACPVGAVIDEGTDCVRSVAGGQSVDANWQRTGQNVDGCAAIGKGHRTGRIAGAGQRDCASRGLITASSSYGDCDRQLLCGGDVGRGQGRYDCWSDYWHGGYGDGARCGCGVEEFGSGLVRRVADRQRISSSGQRTCWDGDGRASGHESECCGGIGTSVERHGAGGGGNGSAAYGDGHSQGLSGGDVG